MQLVTVVLLAALATGMPARAQAPAPDLHAYWDDRCASCHGDAGPFARRTLRVDNGRLVGHHHVDDLDEFLRHVVQILERVHREVGAPGQTGAATTR